MSTALNNYSTRSRAPGTVAISDDEMRRFAPRVFASQPIEGVSERYSFLPTSSILNGMRENGWVPVRAQEQSIRTEARGGFQKLSEYREESRREAHRAPRRVWGQRHQGRSLWLASAGAEPSYMKVYSIATRISPPAEFPISMTYLTICPRLRAESRSR
jgi:hypothetical protein